MMKNNIITEGQKLVGLTPYSPVYKNLTDLSRDLVIRYKQACAAAIDILLKEETEKEIKTKLGTRSKYESRLINFDAKELIEIFINTILMLNNDKELREMINIFDASIKNRGVGSLHIPYYMMFRKMIGYNIVITELKEENQNPFETVDFFNGVEYKNEFILLGTLGNIALFLDLPIIKEELSFGQRAVRLTSDDPWPVVLCKQRVAYIINMMNDLKKQAEEPEIKRLCSEAATQFECAQMWAEKAIKTVEESKSMYEAAGRKRN